MRPTRADPANNVYLRTPHNDWHETANQPIRDYTKEVEQQCDPFWLIGIPHELPLGNWQDYVAGEEQSSGEAGGVQHVAVLVEDLDD
jgi:hypothetical protein